jgi:hypothetical protein
MERIEILERLLAPFPESNDTPEGRMVYQLAWLRQEIEARRLPIPLERKYWSTLAYLIGEGSVDYLGGAKVMGELGRVLWGHGILKPRHHPVVVAMLDDFLEFLKPHAIGLDQTEERLLQGLREIQRDLKSGKVALPLDESKLPEWNKDTPNLYRIPDYLGRKIPLDLSLFGGYRPAACDKGFLPRRTRAWSGTTAPEAASQSESRSSQHLALWEARPRRAAPARHPARRPPASRKSTAAATLHHIASPATVPVHVPGLVGGPGAQSVDGAAEAPWARSSRRPQRRLFAPAGWQQPGRNSPPSRLR